MLHTNEPPAVTTARLATTLAFALGASVVLFACKGTEPAAVSNDGGSASAPAPASSGAALKPATAARALEVPFSAGKPVKVNALVPTGWKQRDGITSWDPPDLDQLPMWHRSFDITATCDGGCTPKELELALPRYLDGVVAHHKKPNMSGNPAKDAVTEARVKELERGDLPQGGKYVLVRVEKPLNALKDPYPDMFAGTCVTRRAKDEVMVVTSVRAAPDDETTWWPVLVAACKGTAIRD